MWINGYVNDNQLVSETETSVLVKLKNSAFKVWISKKCLKTGTHKANFQIGIISDKEYEIFKNGKGQYNKFEKIASEQITGEELAEKLFIQ